MIKKLLSLFAGICLVLTAMGQDIDLSNWKVTIPTGNPEKPSSPIEVAPPEINNFESNEVLKPFFYKDPDDGALVFYANPAQSTRNSKYSRTELREQIMPGSNKVNWTFEQGGRMKGTLAVTDVSKNEKGDSHKVIIMQIHGRLTDEQRDLIGEDDNNAPPVLKIYWQKGKVRVKTKVLKDKNSEVPEILHTKAWTDDSGTYFKEVVGSNKFTLEIIAAKGKLMVTLNGNETLTYEGLDMDKWGVFENYFKAGNYLQTRDEGSYAYVKYYELKVNH